MESEIVNALATILRPIDKEELFLRAHLLVEWDLCEWDEADRALAILRAEQHPAAGGTE